MNCYQVRHTELGIFQGSVYGIQQVVFQRSSGVVHIDVAFGSKPGLNYVKTPKSELSKLKRVGTAHLLGALV